MEEVFEKEKSLLEMQVEQEKQTIKQLEVRLDVARRTIQEAREAQAVSEKELFQVRPVQSLAYSNVFVILFDVTPDIRCLSIFLTIR